MENKHWLWGGIFGGLTVIVYFLVHETIFYPLLNSQLNLLKLLARIIYGLFYALGIPYALQQFGALVFVLGVFYFILIIVLYCVIGAVIGTIFYALRGNKKIRIIFILIFSLVILGFWSSYVLNHLEPASPKDCENNQSYLSKDECYRSLAYENTDYKICDSISSDEIKESCIDQVAQRRGECENSSSPDYCYLYAVESIQRANDCKGRVNQNLQNCLDLKAGKITTEDICKNIKDIDIKNRCIHMQ